MPVNHTGMDLFLENHQNVHNHSMWSFSIDPTIIPRQVHIYTKAHAHLRIQVRYTHDLYIATGLGQQNIDGVFTDH